MPRVENLGASVATWCAATGEGSTTHDLCRPCWTLLALDPHALDAFLAPLGTSARARTPEPRGEDGWGGDVAHPPYADHTPAYGGPATCAACGVILTSEDDDA